MDILQLILALFGFFVLGHVINGLSELAYWKWVDWRASKREE